MLVCASSLSPSGSILLGVGSDRQGRGSVVVWDMSSIVSSGEVRVVAQAHTDVSIKRMRLSFSDSTRCRHLHHICYIHQCSPVWCWDCCMLCHVLCCPSSRMVSCGHGNIRLWRLKGKSLKSCPVDLGRHHHLLFTDVAFPEAAPSSNLGARV